ncbi:phenylalanine--tRNA ligase subunit alpha [Enterobacteriaceae endosymbiont of Macroplea mutica]|nr:phenylalanine--tRNA ligase subunit alpha [Enterobacteriaceae endosymbiont of Macroplea mutica]
MMLTNIILMLKKDISFITNIHDLNLLKKKYLGNDSYLVKQINILKKQQDHTKIIPLYHCKKKIFQIILDYKQKIDNKNINNSISHETIDITLPGRLNNIGAMHPINYIIHKTKNFFQKLDFQEIQGPEIENCYYNFDALNISQYHSIRTKQDTFWINNDILLRTQTSNMQIRIMKIMKPPIRILTYGKVYRNDYDNKHTPMFHQMEGLFVDKQISLTDLKNILLDFINYFFPKKYKIRCRPSYFPFTEPSLEIDIMAQNTDMWIEILGAGLIHPNVLKNVNIDSYKYSGYAFGIGIERLTMLYFNITDIRLLFENDIRFLQQFKYNKNN